MDVNIKDFEGAIAELETVVRRLEEGDLALEQSLELYERGVRLSRYCHARLEAAERRIEVLTEGGEISPAPASLAAVGEVDARADGEPTRKGKKA
jgi:exodeoxyribonuclease VII small subunit